MDCLAICLSVENVKDSTVVDFEYRGKRYRTLWAKGIYHFKVGKTYEARAKGTELSICGIDCEYCHKRKTCTRELNKLRGED